MNSNTFQQEFIVPYYDINPNGVVSPAAILNYLQETAISHSDAVGYGIEKLEEEGVGWVVYRWHLEMQHNPRRAETVRVRTWANLFHGLYATREFILTSEKGNLLGKATSLWIFLDTKRGRPARIPEQVKEAYGTNEARMVEDPFAPLPQIIIPGSGKEFTIRMGDIDTNWHVNNAKYVEWALEALPEEVFLSCLLQKMEVAYHHAVKYGAAVISQIQEVAGEPGTRVFLHKICRQDTGKELTRLRSVWKV